VWMGNAGDPVGMVADVRWQFPDAAAAAAYHAENLIPNSEGIPPIPAEQAPEQPSKSCSDPR